MDVFMLCKGTYLKKPTDCESDAWKSAWFCYWILEETQNRLSCWAHFLILRLRSYIHQSRHLVTNKIMRWQFSLCQVRNYFSMVRVFFFFLCCLGNNTAFGNRAVCPGFLLNKVAVCWLDLFPSVGTLGFWTTLRVLFRASAIRGQMLSVLR